MLNASFQSLTGPTSHSNQRQATCSASGNLTFQSITGPTSHSNSFTRGTYHRIHMFQSLTGPTSHSNLKYGYTCLPDALFQSLTGPTSHSNLKRSHIGRYFARVSIPNGPHKPFQRAGVACSERGYSAFQSLTGPTSHSNRYGFISHLADLLFQSLTGPTSHSNICIQYLESKEPNGFNP